MPSLSLQSLQPRHGLASVDLDIPAGALVLLSGPSGSGKSLLLRAIADLDPHQGRVHLGRQALSAMAPADWRRRVGLLLADSGWWAERVGAHFPVPADLANQAELAHQTQQESALAPTVALLEAVGFSPEVLDWPVARLSTGERQRLALARLLANRPEALLLDEPTANLDPSNRERVESLVLDYRETQQAAVLWVSHDPEQRARLAARTGARRLLIDARRLVEES
ncbi:putative ABC transporter ATP-binding protein YbbL [Thiorhodovibrio winogradskyi]|uniref:ABC transporter ATP-binding protein YbbL n=1 Tax=Thiorhodovibrio winogradskyi TaxID=77007 RepID=A0ABZ0SC83_9GAMM|nr:ABC transporter ATP-binding protein [Thiorhodovibrio winogradskyi]